MKKILCIALFSILVIVPAAGAQAAVWYVDGDVSSSGAGTTWGTAKKTIGEAITAAATTGDEIWVKEGTYAEGTLTISKGVSLYGGFAGSETSRSQRDWETNVTTIDGEGTIDHCFYVDTIEVGGAIDGFTITGGDADGGGDDNEGGGIYLGASHFTIANCTFTGNNAVFGGAIYTSSSVVTDSTITNCTFTGNTATTQGGAINNSGGDPTISNCTFSDNSAPNGGAIANDGYATPTITSCTFAGNDASSAGGAIFNGGGGADPNITSCSFKGNTAAFYGGAIMSGGSNDTITNCTFAGNEASSSGGAIAGMYSATVIINNCILWGNSATASGDEIYTDGSTVTVNYSDVEGGTVETWFGTGCIDINPLFMDVSDPDAANWDLHLQTSSPCIDQGDDEAPDIPDYDFEEEPRIYDGDADGTPTVDMGADEVYFFPQCVATSGELEDALETAESNGSHDCIQVVQGLYYGSFEYNSSEGRSITLEGGYTEGCANRVLDPANTILDAGGTNKVLDFDITTSGDVLVDGFTIQNGAASVDGGGVYAYLHSIPGMTGTVTLTNNIITGNTAGGDGGGVYAHTWSNSGTTGDIIITDNTIFGNDGNFGGGVNASSYSSSGTAGTVTCTNNIIFGNDANYGGGVCANSSSGSGTAGSVTCTNNTITGNNADYGGGVHLYNSGGSGGTINCYNNIIWGNTASSAGDILLTGTVTTYGYNNDYSSLVGSWDYGGGTNIDADPLFVDAGAGDYHLQTGSPCIDAGDNTAPAIPTYDFEGDPRVADGDHNGTPTVDMGADEVPAIWYVDWDIGTSGDGTSWGEAFETISEALSAASAGDEIWVKQGTYDGLSGSLMVNIAVGLYAGFTGTETARSQRDWETYTTTVDGEDGVVCFQVTDDAVIDGFTITGGDSTFNGGGMYIGNDGSPLIVNCTFTDNNAANYGGAIYIYASSPTLENCTFSNNAADTTTGMGGAIHNILTGSSSPTITNCTFSATNTAGFGGAISNLSTYMIISDSTFSGNTAENGGGGIYNNNSSPTITDCTFSGNTAGSYAGGIANASSSPTITNCTFTDNTVLGTGSGGGIMNGTGCFPTITDCTFRGNSAYNGGGIRNDTAAPVITNCLFYYNSATNLAGGIFNYISANATITNCTFYGNSADSGGAVGNTLSDPAFTNCILWGDSATTSGDEIYVLSGSPTFTYCDIEGGYTGTGNIDINPLFMAVTDPDPLNWDLHLRSNSPCIDQGDNAAPSLPETDFEGDARIINATVDMGADETLIIPVAGSSAVLCPDGLGFGEVETSSTRNLNLVMNNTTDSDIDVDPITVTPSPPYSITIDNCSGVTLHPGDTCSIRVQFAPVSTGPFYDSFQIPTDDPEAGTVTVALAGMGISPPPLVDVGSTETRGSAPSGPGATTALDGSESNSRGDATPASPPVVADSPSSTSTAPVGSPEPSAGVENTTPGPASQLMISSLPPDILREPEKELLLEEELEPFDVMVFGAIQIGASDQLRIIFSHEQGAAIHMGDIILPSDPYVIVEDKCSGGKLGPGGECAVTVQFAPSTANNFYDYFLIPTGDPEVGTLRINLEGMGVNE